MNKKLNKAKQKKVTLEKTNVSFFFLMQADFTTSKFFTLIDDFIKKHNNISFNFVIDKKSTEEIIQPQDEINIIKDEDNNVLKAIKDSEANFFYFVNINLKTDLKFIDLIGEYLNSNKKTNTSIINFINDKNTFAIACVENEIAQYLFESRNQNYRNLLNELNFRLIKLGYKNEYINGSANIGSKTLLKNKGKDNLLNRFHIHILNLFFWFIVLPIRELKSKPLKKFNFLQEHSIYRFLFFAVIIFSFFLLPYFSLDAGNSGDEETWQYPQSIKIINFYKSLGKDKSYADSPANFATYGMSFDTITTFIIQTLNIKNIYEARHIFNSWAGWLTILLVGILLKKIFDWRAALIAITLLIFSPRFLGHSWNNPKDIPFAMGFTFSLVYMITYFKEFPKIKPKTILLLIIGIGITIGNRVGGLLLIAYFGLFSGLFYLFTLKSTHLKLFSHVDRIKKLTINFFVVSIGGYLLGLPLWPYALQNPFSKPFEALKILTNYSVSLRQLFSGETIWSDSVPWEYVPKYFLITSPIIILLGLVPFLYFWFKEIKTRNSFLYFCIFFSIVFPISYIIYKNSNVYGGLRHSLFVYPSIVIASSIGIYKLLTSNKNRIARITMLSISLILLINPVVYTFANHPLQYVYFNQFIGGVKGAYGKYELDYYFHSLKKASNWFIENELPKAKKDTLTITTNFNISYYFRDYKDKIKTSYVRYYDRGNSDWDYAIIANTYINPEQLKKNNWPPENTIHTIDVDGVPICAILKRNNKLDLEGYQKLKKRDFFGAIRDLNKSIEQEKTNEAAYMNLATAYMYIRQFDRAKATIQKLLEVYPKYDKGLNLLGLVYYNQKNYEEAYKIFTSITEMNPKFVSAYHNLGLVFLRMNKKSEAIKYFQKAIKTNKKYKASYLAIANILKEAGKENEAKKYIDAANKIK